MGSIIPTPGKRPLYNGNINSMAVNINYPGGAVAPQSPQLYNYSYDQLNRITGMDVFRSSTLSTFNDWRDMLVVGDYKERVSYDANGNILRYLRQGFGSNLPMDSLTYNYNYTGGRLTNNKLNYVTDKIGGSTAHSTNYSNDIENQAAGNYTYDAIGNLTKDIQEGITNIEWNVYGKIRRITRTATGANPITSIRYNYDAAGNRILKTVTRSATDSVEYTAYVRDASGNVMATYLAMDAPNGSINSSATLLLREQHIYGSSRIGILNRNVSVGTSTFTNPSILNFIRGNKFFELSNHLGNVLVTLSDKKIGVDANADGIIDYYNANVVTANDYYPFGMLMPGRTFTTATGYRYGFNGKENDNEVKGEANQQDYGMRIYDPRIGKFLSADPLSKSFAWYTPYQFAGNKPIYATDLDGLEENPYSLGRAEQSNREWAENLKKTDPHHADEKIDKANLNAFVLVTTPLSFGSSTVIKVIGGLWVFYQTQRVFGILNQKAVTPEQKKENFEQLKQTGADIFIGLGTGYFVGKVYNSWNVFKVNSETHIDIGGYGKYPNAKNYTTSGVDYEGKAIPNLVQGRAEINLKEVPINSIDKITIENAPFNDEIMTEASRVLAPNGQLSITTPSPGHGVFEGIAKKFELKILNKTTSNVPDGAGGTFESTTVTFTKPKK
jgi:RHS repeat-associated protein